MPQSAAMQASTDDTRDEVQAMKRPHSLLALGFLAACSPAAIEPDAGLVRDLDATHLTAYDGAFPDAAYRDAEDASLGCPIADPRGDLANDGFESFDDGAVPTGSPHGLTWTSNHSTQVSTLRARRGTRALRFTYPARPNPPPSDTVIEQRFAFSRPLTDFWLKYDLFVPTNYADRSVNGTNDFGGGSKELALFSDGYSAPSPTEIYPTLILGRLFRRIDRSNPAWVNNGSSWQSGSFSYAGADGMRVWAYLPDTGIESAPPMIDVRTDRGTWQRRIIHVRMPRTATAQDGVVAYWNTRCDGTTDQLVDIQNGAFHGSLHANSAGGNYITDGYLLGSSNNGFDEETTFFIDDVVVSTTNLWGVE